MKRSGKALPVGLQDRVGRVDDVEVDGAVVGVDDDLDGVADVVEPVIEVGALEPVDRRPLRVRVPVRRRVGVEDPLDATVDDDRIRVLVEGQERRQRTGPVVDVAHVVDATVGPQVPGEHGVEVAEAESEGGPPEERADADPVGTAVGRGDVLAVVGLEVRLVDVRSR